MKILCIIPARSGSKGVKNKNIKLMLGKPLIYYTIKEALNCKKIDRVIVSTDCEEIKKISIKYGAEVPFIRPKAISGDKTPMKPVIKHTLEKLKIKEKYKPYLIMILQPTSPLRNVMHIEKAIELISLYDSDSLVSVTEIPHSMSPFSAMKLNKSGYLKPLKKINENQNIRQIKPIYYARNGAAIYIFYNYVLEDQNSIYGKKLIPLFMKKEESIDIDDEQDFEIAEYLLGKKLNYVNQQN